jgi:hypothetical protein
MKKLLLTLTVAGFAVAAQAGDDCCSAAKTTPTSTAAPSCSSVQQTSANTKAGSSCSAVQQTAVTKANSCCSTTKDMQATSGKARLVVKLQSPKEKAA